MESPADVKSNEAAEKTWTDVHGVAPGLVGVSGKIRLQVKGKPVGVLQVEENGEVSIVPDFGGEVGATAMIDREDTLLKLLEGEAPPIVAVLRGRLRIQGDGLLALRVLFGLEAGSPWALPHEVAETHAL
jgi:hypothetical protein